jgi:3-phosphoglycerate kinase
VIDSLLAKCDKIIIGGGMIFTFYKARGLKVGGSLVEEDKLELAKELEAKAKELGVEFILPVDVIVADKFAPDANTQVVDVENIPDGWMGLDIGPKSIDLLNATLADCQTVIWNGPMGVFEFEKFAKGTFAIADTLAKKTGESQPGPDHREEGRAVPAWHSRPPAVTLLLLLLLTSPLLLAVQTRSPSSAAATAWLPSRRRAWPTR